jgi:hypothetical protein
MMRRWKLAAGAVVLVVLLGFLTLRYGAQVIAPFLPEPGAPPDSQSAGATLAATTVRDAPSDPSGAVLRYGPFAIDGSSYSIEVQRDTGGAKPREAARRVQVLDAARRVVYDENLFRLRDSTSAEDWLELSPVLIEDASGRAHGFEFSYSWFPSAPGSGVAFNVVAPRGDSLVVLTPTMVGYYGSEGVLPGGSGPGLRRLLPGNRMVIESGRGWFTALVNLRINFDCVPRSEGCTRIDMPDSISGLARFDVRPSARQRLDSAVAVDLYAMPHGAIAERIVIPAGAEPEILGGAGRLYFERTPGLFLSAEDEWLEVRVNGRRGWITGAESFEAIGLRQAG